MGFFMNIVEGFFFIAYGSCSKFNIISTGDNKMYNTHDYGLDVKNRSSMLFRVKGCNDGYLRLYDGPDFSTAKWAYICIGGWANNKCKMIPCDGCNPQYSKVYPYLSCNEMRPTWVKWTGGLLSAGEGAYVGERTFIYTKDQRDFEVQYLSVGSGWDRTFDWEFDLYPGNHFQRVMPYGWSTRQMLSSVTASSKVNCIVRCHSRVSCKSVSYQSTTNTCQLYFERPRSSDIHLDNTWETLTERNM